MTTTQTPPAQSEAPPAPPAHHPYAQLAVLAVGFIMATLDATVVNVAGSNIGTSLHMPLSAVAWVVDGYVLTFAALLLLAGALAGSLGARRMYIAGLVVFVAASAVCAMAPTAATLIAARLVQGVGAAMFMPSTLGLLGRLFPDAKERGKALGVWSAIVSTASGLGPFIGGSLVQMAGWRSIFYLNLPLGIIGILLALRMIPNPPGSGQRTSISAHIALIAALAGLCFALIEGPAVGWADTKVLVAIAVAFVSAACLAIQERQSTHPLVPRPLLANALFRDSNTIGFLLNLALFGTMFMLGLYLQRGRGADAWMAGVQLLPMMLVFVVGNLAFARIAKKVGAVRPLALALSVAAVGGILIAFIGVSSPLWVLTVLVAIVNLAVGVTVPAMTTVLMEGAGAENGSLAGATLNANRQVGALVGVAGMTALLNSASSWNTGAQRSFILMAAAYTIAAILAWRIKAARTEEASE